MRRVRRRIACLAGGVLILQACLLASVPTAVCLGSPAGEAIAAACTCDHEDGQRCPMHHRPGASAPKTAPDPCTCRSTNDPGAAIVAALFGPAAVLVSATDVPLPFTPADAVHADCPSPLDAVLRLDAPPPRA